MAKVVCPNCGSEMVLPEHSSMCMGMSIGEDTKGTFVLPMKNKGDSEMTGMEKIGINALASLGIDVSKLDAKVIEQLQAAMNSTSVQETYEDGYVKNNKIHRRWIFAQTMKLIQGSWGQCSWTNKGWTENMNRWYSHDYTMQYLAEELRVLSKLASRDEDCFEKRKRFFTPSAVVQILMDYKAELIKHCSTLPQKKCKGVPYVRVNGRDIFVSDLSSKVYSKVDNVIYSVGCNLTSYTAMYRIIKDFLDSRDYVKLPWNTKKSPTWVDCFKGAGAYYTLDNLIKFKGCTIPGFSRDESLRLLEARTNEYKGEFWRLHALLKKVIEDNRYDFKEDMAKVYNR